MYSSVSNPALSSGNRERPDTSVRKVGGKVGETEELKKQLKRERALRKDFE